MKFYKTRLSERIKTLRTFKKKACYIPGCIEFHTTNLCVL
jgi:hypothetical protein